jgi:hypothetical protein
MRYRLFSLYKWATSFDRRQAMDGCSFQTVLLELRLAAYLAHPFNPSLTLALLETEEAIRGKGEMTFRSDRVTASPSLVLCWQFPGKTGQISSTGVFFLIS